MTKNSIFLITLNYATAAHGAGTLLSNSASGHCRRLHQLRFRHGHRLGTLRLAQARAVAAAAEGMARNPGASAAIRFALLLGLILIESLALYTLVVIFVQIK
jgi:hypothetical protein